MPGHWADLQVFKCVSSAKFAALFTELKGTSCTVFIKLHACLCFGSSQMLPDLSHCHPRSHLVLLPSPSFLYKTLWNRCCGVYPEEGYTTEQERKNCSWEEALGTWAGMRNGASVGEGQDGVCSSAEGDHGCHCSLPLSRNLYPSCSQRKDVFEKSGSSVTSP